MKYKKEDLEDMTTIGIYMLLEEEGADVHGLWSAPKSVLMKTYEEQIGFA